MTRRAQLRRRIQRLFVRPIDIPAALRGAALTLLCSTVLIAVIIQYNGSQEEIERRDTEIAALRDELDDRNELADCRSRLAAGVSDENTSFLLALGDLVEALPTEDPTLILDALSALGDAGDQLDAARDARNAFEANPEACP